VKTAAAARLVTSAGRLSYSRALNMLIGTHSGTFHCDEALACFLLKTLPEYRGASILRYALGNSI
jgi:hypothetical protein